MINVPLVRTFEKREKGEERVRKKERGRRESSIIKKNIQIINPHTCSHM
jgi:hypothetical protein